MSRARRRKAKRSYALAAVLQGIQSDADRYIQAFIDRLGTDERGSPASLVRPMTPAERDQLPRAAGVTSGRPMTPLESLDPQYGTRNKLHE